LRATGVEAERTVALATLQGVLWPLRDAVGELDERQSALLGGVLDLGPQAGASTFAIGAGTLSLLSVASRERTVVVVVDDAHWADVASQEALAFVGRRLEHERTALLVGVRSSEPSLVADEHSFARLELGPLDGGPARALLGRSGADGLVPNVA